MSAPPPPDAGSGAAPRTGSLRRRLAVFAAVSVGLHLVVLLIVQTLGLRAAPDRADEPPPVTMVELPPLPAPQAAPPEPQPPAPEPTPEPEPEPPEQRAEPEPRPEPAPRRQAEAPEAPAVTVAPPDEDEDDAGEAGGVIVPGLRHGGGRGDTDMAAFRHAVECSSIDIRYEDYCADIGPIYLAEQDPARLAAETEEIWRRQRIQEELMMVPIPAADGEIPDFMEFEKRNMTLRQHLGLREKH